MELRNIFEQYPDSLYLFNEINYSIVDTKTPVSLLYELCTNLKIPQPNFTHVASNGESHKLCFESKIENYSIENGFGRTKQLSKDANALNMLKKLKEISKKNKFRTDLEKYMQVFEFFL
jgi:dsRNA-specific ribonuclease